MTDLTMSQFASKDDLIAAQAVRIAELESQLEAIGAGGVEPLRKGFVRLTDVLARLEQGFGANSAPVTTIKRHFEMQAAPAHPAEGVPAQAVQPSDALIEAVDAWFADNTGLGGCSDKDVAELAAIFATQPAAQGLESATLDALQEAESVLNSINMGKQHKVVQADGDVTYWQREEWCKWAKDEVLPKVTVALAAQAKQGGASHG